MGLDPQGYGNPDFCWLSLQDTLIWSFAGPIGAVIIVSGVLGDVGSWSALGGGGRAGLAVGRPRPQTQGLWVPVHVHCETAWCPAPGKGRPAGAGRHVGPKACPS